MCRALGIPARSVYGFTGWQPWMKPEELKDFSKLDTQLSPLGTAGAGHRGLAPHMWVEFYAPNVGWIPADPTVGTFGDKENTRFIMSKGRDVEIGPHGPDEHDGYGFQWVLLHNGRVDGLLSGVWNIAHIRNARCVVLHTAPFPLAKYLAYFGTALFLAVAVGGLAGSACYHNSKKYALLGLATVVPVAGLVFPAVSIWREGRTRCSRLSLAMLFWMFSLFLLLLFLFAVVMETDVLPGRAWEATAAVTICALSLFLAFIFVDLLFRRLRIRNRALRGITKAVAFVVCFVAALFPVMGVIKNLIM